MLGWSATIVADTVTPILAGFPSRLEGEVEKELDIVGAEMKDISWNLVSVRTGFLQSTIYYTVTGFVLEFGAAANYAWYVECGTWHMTARPFIRPALDESSQRILDAILVGAMNALEA